MIFIGSGFSIRFEYLVNYIRRFAQFFDEANEAKVWLKEKRPVVTSSDYGKDEDSVLSLIKKLEAVERELSAFQHTVGRLSNLSQSLVNRSHFDSKNITQIQVNFRNTMNLEYTSVISLILANKI